MRKLVFLSLIFSILLTSCATVLNNSKKRITIHSEKPIKIRINNDSIISVSNEVSIDVERKKEPLIVMTVSDSLTTRLLIDSKNSTAFYGNIFTYGLGFLVDWSDPKRYSYPSDVYINSAGTFDPNKKTRSNSKKGDFSLIIGIPYINNFHLQPKGEGVKNNTGFWGISLGADYNYANKSFLNVSISGSSDFFLPIIAAVDIGGQYEIMNSLNASVSNNHRFGRFSIGYGLAYSHNIWALRDGAFFDEEDWENYREPVTKASNSIGLVFPSYIRIGRTFHAGINYKPSFFQFGTDSGFRYEHVISLEVLWKFRLNG